MAIESKTTGLFSIPPSQQFGLVFNYGQGHYGTSKYGAENPFFSRTPYGNGQYGDQFYGDVIDLAGIYQKYHFPDGVGVIKRRFYTPANPQTVPQQANRQKYADAVNSWQALTQEQRNVYNKKAIGRHMSGYNLYIKEYMLSF